VRFAGLKKPLQIPLPPKAQRHQHRAKDSQTQEYKGLRIDRRNTTCIERIKNIIVEVNSKASSASPPAVSPTSDLSNLPLAPQYLAKDPLSQNYRDSIGFQMCNKSIESVIVKVNLKASSAGRCSISYFGSFTFTYCNI
jgi:hypothetical protein